MQDCCDKESKLRFESETVSWWKGGEEKVSPDPPLGLGRSNKFRQNFCWDWSGFEYFYFKWFMSEATHDRTLSVPASWGLSGSEINLRCTQSGGKQEVFLRVEGDGEARTAGDPTTQCVAHNHGSGAKAVMSETLLAQRRQIGSCASNLWGRRRGNVTEFPLIEGRKQIKVF